MSRLLAVSDAAHELGVHESRVRALIDTGELDAEKVGGRWLVDAAAVSRRKREQPSPGRPLSPRNAWALLLVASGEPPGEQLDSVSRWRLRQSLAHQDIGAMRAKLKARGRPRYFRALPGELRALHASNDLMLTGSSATGRYELGLLSPDAIDAYVPAHALANLIAEHALGASSSIDANVTLRAVPDDAWPSPARRYAPPAAVALDLVDYFDSRSSRVGCELLDRLDRETQGR